MTGEKIVDVLLVEDNPTDEELTLRALKKNEVCSNIVVVRDGAEALDWLSAKGKHADRDVTQRPKVILLDLKIPKVNGLEVLGTIMSDDDLKRIPVVVLTSSNQDRDIDAAYQLGANSYIVKPVHYDKFIKAVTDLGIYWQFLNETPKS